MMGLDQPWVEAPLLGDMPPAPFTTNANLAEAMADHLRFVQPRSGAEGLRALRRAFPDSPLTLRVVALGALMRR
jgi:hypothetical protein